VREDAGEPAGIVHDANRHELVWLRAPPEGRAFGVTEGSGVRAGDHPPGYIITLRGTEPVHPNIRTLLSVHDWGLPSQL
jgi:hypothetical protein